MTTTTARMSYEDLLATPDDDYLYELVRGEILRMPSPKGMHGAREARIVGAIERYLYARAEAQGWTESQGSDARDRLVGRIDNGEAGIRFALPDDPDQIRGVDVAYLTPEQVALHEQAGRDEYVPLVPALVVEVISQSEAAGYIQEKTRDYLAGGAQLMWLLFPKTRTAQVHRPGRPILSIEQSGSLDGEEVLPGLRIPLKGIFS